jgi:hypothetical protein
MTIYGPEPAARVYFCAGDYCPGYRWPASNVPHPSSCAYRVGNTVEDLREAAARRRAHGRAVSWESPAPATVEMETSDSGCFIAHVEDETGEHVVLQTEEEQP